MCLLPLAEKAAADFFGFRRMAKLRTGVFAIFVPEPFLRAFLFNYMKLQSLVRRMIAPKTCADVRVSKI